MYGEATALLSVGYEYVTCSSIVWETLTATLHGFHMDISDVGGWNLDIHHMYNFEAGEWGMESVVLSQFIVLHVKQPPS